MEVDPELYAIAPAKAIDNGIGRESVLSLASRYGAVAGVNGGFFAMRGTLDGRAAGALKIEEWIALPTKLRGCIGWTDPRAPKFGRLMVEIRASAGPIDGFNRARATGEAVIYTPRFNRTTLTAPDGEELVVREGKVQAVRQGGSTPIPDDGYVLSIQQEHPLYGTLAAGDSFDFDLIAQGWEDLQFIVGGTPLLITDSEPIRDWSIEQTRESFLLDRHARTAVGRKADGHWLFVVADATSHSSGLTMNELVDLMLSLGCVDALNLDGGGSSTMVVEAAVVNDPHGDEDEGQGEQTVRRVSDAILIRTR